MFEKENVWRINDLQPRERAVSVRSKATLLPMMLRCACASISPGIDWIKRAARVVECLELQLARLDLSEASRGATRKRRSPPSFDCRSSWSKGASMKNK